MSGFFGSGDSTRWGGLLKQAISNVETTFDTLLEQQQQNQGNIPANNNAHRPPTMPADDKDGETETETYVDPISGMVTTVQRPKKSPQPQKRPQKQPPRSESPVSSNSSLAHSTSDLSARLAAVMAEKRSVSRTSSLSSNSGRPERSSMDGSIGSPKAARSVVEKAEVDESSEEQATAEEPVKSPAVDSGLRENIEENAPVDAADKDVANDPLDLSTTPLAANPLDMAEVELSKAELSNAESPKAETPPVESPNAPKAETAATPESPQTEEVTDKNEVAKMEKAKIPEVESPKVKANKHEPAEGKKSQDTILKQREEQLFQAMQNIANLHDQIHALQEEAEKQASARAKAQAQLQELEGQLAKANRSGPGNTKKLESTIEDLKQQLATKAEQVQGLMEEGEKLSKTELKHMSAIKKLRAEKQEHDRVVAELQKKIDRSSNDLVEANTKIMKATEMEKRLQDKVRVLSDMTERQTKHINKLETELMTLKEQKTQAELALKDAMDHMESERDKIHAESKNAHAAMLEKEVKTVEKLRDELATVRESSEEKEKRLHDEIRELQTALQSSQTASGSREDSLRNEVSELQHRIRELETSTEDIDSTVAEATSSLLEQIESLQKQHSAAIKNRDHNEQGIILRLQTAETERDEAKRKFKESSDKFESMSERLEQAEQDLMQEKREIAKERAEFEADRATVSSQTEELEKIRKELEEYKAKETEMEDVIKKRYQKLMKERLQEEKNQLERKFKAEHIKVFQKQMKQAEAPEQDDASNDSNSISEGSYAKLPVSNSPIASPRSSSDTNSYSKIASSSTATPTIVLDRLQSNMRRMENQLNFYQTQLESTTQSRDELSEEILIMTVEVENLRKEIKRVPELEGELRELNERYHASLELLGERTEQVEELKADIADVKEMYRNQIVELVGKK